MLKKLKSAGKRSKEKLTTSKLIGGRKSTKTDLVIGGPVLVNDFSDRQLAKNSPARPMTRVDIHQLVREGNLKEMKKHRFTAEEVNLADPQGMTPLHVACDPSFFSAEVVNYLISLGADPNRPDREGWTALHSACKHEQCLPIIPLLCKGDQSPSPN